MNTPPHLLKVTDKQDQQCIYLPYTPRYTCDKYLTFFCEKIFDTFNIYFKFCGTYVKMQWKTVKLKNSNLLKISMKMPEKYLH